MHWAKLAAGHDVRSALGGSLGTVLQFTGLGIFFLPLLVLGWTAWRRLGSSAPWPSVPLDLWLPVIANVVTAMHA